VDAAIREPEAEVAAVAIGVEKADGPGRPGLDRRAARVAGDPKGAVGRAVVATVLGKNLGPAGQHAGEDEGLVISLAAAVDEEAAVQVAGGAPGQFRRQGRPVLRHHLRRDTAGPLCLARDRLDDPAVTVAEGAVKHLRDEVEVAPALPVEEVHSLGMVEFQHGVFPLLDRPRQEQMAPQRLARGHRALRCSRSAGFGA